MALQSFTWNNGTNDNPVSLNSQQLSALVKLANNSNILKDVRGHVTTVSGTISRYDKYVLNQVFQNLVVHATEQSDSFALAASRATINEGEESAIIVTGLATSAVDFAIEHTVTGRSGIEESAVKAKIRMDGNVLVVDAPQENASWQDIVRVKAKPVYEDWGNSSVIRYVDITVRAVALSGVTLTGNGSIPVGNTAEVTVNLIPSNCTKSSGVSFSNTLVSDGSLPVIQPLVSNGKIYVTAPAEECGLTLTTNVHLFGDENVVAFYAAKQFEVRYPYIQFEVTTDGTFSDISSANPAITLQKVDAVGENIGNPIVLTGSVSGDSLIYVYGGGSVAGDGSERYLISIGDVRGYSIDMPSEVVPDGVETIISAAYAVIQPDVYIVYTDGTEQSYDDFEARGYSFVTGKTPYYLRLVNGIKTLTLALIDGAESSALHIGCYAMNVAGGDYWGDDEEEDINNHLNGFTATTAVARMTYNGVSVLSEDCSSDRRSTAVMYARSKSIEVGGVTYQGYVPACGETHIIAQNFGKLYEIYYAFNSNFTLPTKFVSSTLIEGNEQGAYYVNRNPVGKSWTFRRDNAMVVPCFNL